MHISNYFGANFYSWEYVESTLLVIHIVGSVQNLNFSNPLDFQWKSFPVLALKLWNFEKRKIRKFFWVSRIIRLFLTHLMIKVRWSSLKHHFGLFDTKSGPKFGLQTIKISIIWMHHFGRLELLSWNFQVRKRQAHPNVERRELFVLTFLQNLLTVALSRRLNFVTNKSFECQPNECHSGDER